MQDKNSTTANPGPEGWVYLLETAGYYKIGFTNTDPEARVRALQTGSPTRIRNIASMRGTASVEAALHAALDVYRIRGEWFTEDVVPVFLAVASGAVALSGRRAPGAAHYVVRAKSKTPARVIHDAVGLAMSATAALVGEPESVWYSHINTGHDVKWSRVQRWLDRLEERGHTVCLSMIPGGVSVRMVLHDNE